ncbi:hypothetical protein FBUS_09924 [Fasciolopsis buskii]|uniref:Uncharacterized protein n=1 Tax=Fasciolopsis buskii TaxID=27845 RepID=A0A8E0RQY8_9TREM|nr:hypothetical protein FBUS_09924 [Fasciolopsis buski]
MHLFKKLADSLRCSQSSTKDDSGFEPSPDCSFSDSGQPLAHSSPRKDFSQSGEKESFRLTDVYSRVFGSVQTHAHSAEGDCLAMMELLQYLGIPAIDWLQENYTDFNHIRYMYPPVYHPTATESENRSLLGETACQLEGMKLD